MSFLKNSFKGFGRNTKKDRKDYDQPSQLHYQNQPFQNNQIRRPQSPSRSSPTKQQRTNNQLQFSSQQTSPGRSRQHQSQDHLNSSLQGSVSEKPLFLCDPFVKTALVKGPYSFIVQLPKYVDNREWLAVNVYDIFTLLSRFYGVFSEYVTPEAYPTMNAGPNVNYTCLDTNNNQVSVPACEYINFFLTNIDNRLNDQSIFPTKNGGTFPPSFFKECKNICRQMFRIFAHIYHNHFDKILHLSLEAHWNSLFAHFMNFVKEFNLVERKELDPLLPLIEILEERGIIV